MSTIIDHKGCQSHIRATEQHKKDTITGAQIMRTDAGRDLLKLQQIDKHRLYTLFRNAHAVIKHNMPRDYERLFKLDSTKGINLGH